MCSGRGAWPGGSDGGPRAEQRPSCCLVRPRLLPAPAGSPCRRAPSTRSFGMLSAAPTPTPPPSPPLTPTCCSPPLRRWARPGGWPSSSGERSGGWGGVCGGCRVDGWVGGGGGGGARDPVAAMCGSWATLSFAHLPHCPGACFGNPASSGHQRSAPPARAGTSLAVAGASRAPETWRTVRTWTSGPTSRFK